MEFGYQDIGLVPRILSTIESRDDLNIELKLAHINLKSPIIASPMMDVCDGMVSSIMRSSGGIGIIHRFMSIDDQVIEYNKCHDSACAIGVNSESIDRYNKLYQNGCRIFCIDTANGANTRVLKTIESMKHSDTSIIVGNVASKECYSILEQFDNVKAIRVGIAGGSACTTKNATGIYRGMLSAIYECASVKKKTILIADGGINEPSDMCKSIAFGADMIMLGGILAATKESPAEVIQKDNKLYKVYHGSASFEIQREYREKPKYIEGTTRLLEFKNESIIDVINRFMDGFKSSMSYFNSRSISEYRNNIDYIHIRVH